MLSTKHPNENQTDRYLLTTYFWSYRELLNSLLAAPALRYRRPHTLCYPCKPESSWCLCNMSKSICLLQKFCQNSLLLQKAVKNSKLVQKYAVLWIMFYRLCWCKQTIYNRISLFGAQTKTSSFNKENIATM